MEKYTRNEDKVSDTRVTSTEKALRILDCFSVTQPELSLAQLSRSLGMPKSTTLNQIRTLESAGYLYKVRNTPNYRLGYKILELNYRAHSSMPIVQYAMPLMVELQTASGLNVYLTTHINGRVLFLECLHTNTRAVAYSVAGRSLPMHSTGCGKVMLSRMPQEEVDRIIGLHGLAASTENTFTDYSQLMKELELTRQRGYAIDNEEDVIGGKCVATAVCTSRGAVAGALSISGSIISMSDDNIGKYAKLLLDASQELIPQAHLFPAIQLQS